MYISTALLLKFRNSCTNKSVNHFLVLRVTSLNIISLFAIPHWHLCTVKSWNVLTDKGDVTVDILSRILTIWMLNARKQRSLI